MTLRFYLALSLCTSALALAFPAWAQNEKNEDHVDCALILEGVQRLACYDAQRNPQAAREEAKEKALEHANQRADILAVDEEQREEIVGNALEDDPDSGVMDSLVSSYLEAEKSLFNFTGSFVSHKPNYILPVTWVKHPNYTPYSPRLGATFYDYDLTREEAKYQLSFKVPLLTGIFDKKTTFWFGYTQKSLWQVYNQDESAPFRETNYEPELFVRHQLNWNIGPGTLNTVSVGLNHQSNGQADPRSRSWNRIMGSAAYSYNRWLFMVKPWLRLPERSSDDDNADIERYLGHASYHAVYKLTADRTFSLKLLNNLRSDNRTSVEFGYSFPMGDSLKGFFQYYNGYGESLIDYNVRIERFGIGVMLNDWL